MKKWLQEHKHSSLFLDFDPESGIKAGTDWEQALYDHLRRCQAVVPLLTPDWLTSKWCFAEFVHARAQGKAIFPVKIKPCEPDGVIGNIQQIDLTRDADEGYGRLERALSDVFDWDGSRPPYPGLMAFQEEDAAMFFGRHAEIAASIERLESLRRQGRRAPHFLLFVGPSGSGKSSLVRAGVIPRLRRNPDRWMAVPAFRPREDPLAELALSLTAAFEALNHPRDLMTLTARLTEAARQAPPDGGAVLHLTRELTLAGQRRDATVLLFIDQAEELFGASAPEPAARFLRLLRAALERCDGQLIALATLRSDFLGAFQTHPFLCDRGYPAPAAYAEITVDPMPEDRFREVIRGPAERAQLLIDDDLVDRMVHDTGTPNALPLLAFTLRRLWDDERIRRDNRFSLREYDTLGGLEGAIRNAADEVLDLPRRSKEELESLHGAFVPTMVRVNAEGEEARRRAYLDEMPRRAEPLLRRFVEARLLVTARQQDGRETIEVAHESLLRIWPQLRSWLQEDQDELRLLDSLHRAAAEWQDGGRGADLLVHRDGRLRDGLDLVRNRRFALKDGSLDKAYVDACVAAQRARDQAEAEERERRIRDAERIADEQRKTTKRTRLGAAIGITLAIVSIAAGLYAWGRKQSADEAQQRAQRDESKALAAVADLERQGSPATAVRVALASLPRDLSDPKRPYAAAAEAALYRALWDNRALKVLQSEGGSVNLVRFSPDGASVVTVSADGSASLWDAASGEQIALLDYPEGKVKTAIVSEDGAKAVSVSGDGTARLWDLSSRTPIASLQGHAEEIRTAAFSLEGKALVTVDKDANARLWNASNGKPLAQFHISETWFGRTLALSPDGSTLALGLSDFTVRLWNSATGTEVSSLRGHQHLVTGIAFSADGRKLVTASLDQTARLWDRESAEEIAVLRGHPASVSTITAVAFDPKGNVVVTTSNDGTARLWRVAGGDPIAVLRGHQSMVKSAAFSPDGTRVATGSSDDTARLWDVETGALIAVLPGHEGEVGALAFSPDGTMLATASDDGTVRLWRAARERRIGILHGHDGTVTSARFSSDGTKVVTASADYTARVWDAASLQVMTVLRGHEGHVLSASFSPDDARVVTASADGTARLWDAMTGAEILRLGAPYTGRVYSAAFSPNGALVATGSDDRMGRFWDVSTGNETRLLRGHKEFINSVAFSPDGKTFATASWDGTARLWKVANGQELFVLRGHDDSVESLAFSADGRQLVTASRDRTARLWLVSSGQQIKVLRSSDGWYSSAVFSPDPDGRRVVTASVDGAATLWDTSSGTAVVVFRGQHGTESAELGLPAWGNSLYSVAFNPEGTRLITASQNGTADVWPVLPSGQALIEFACQSVPWPLTSRERERLGISRPVCDEMEPRLR